MVGQFVNRCGSNAIYNIAALVELVTVFAVYAKENDFKLSMEDVKWILVLGNFIHICLNDSHSIFSLEAKYCHTILYTFSAVYIILALVA